jgi:CheY-like chemotaxis protein
MKRINVRFSVSRRRVTGASEKKRVLEQSAAGSKKSGAARSRQGSGSAIGAPALQSTLGRSRLDYSLLITDDDPAFRETLRGIFEPEGFHTFLAHSGEEALEILERNPVHIALLDQHLPRLTGLETLRIIRQVNAILPVIILTAESTQQLMRDALSAHAFCVMSKPVTRSVVVYTVQQALSRSYRPSGNIETGGTSQSAL